LKDTFSKFACQVRIGHYFSATCPVSGARELQSESDNALSLQRAQCYCSLTPACSVLL